MELTSLDFRSILFSLLIFLGTCNFNDTAMKKSSVRPKSEVHLIMPKEQQNVVQNYDSVSTKFTLILLHNDVIFAYEGMALSHGQLYNYATIRKAIASAKTKFSNKLLVVLIKPTKQASYKNTVDILDDMSINHILKYQITDPSAIEINAVNPKDFLHTDN